MKSKLALEGGTPVREEKLPYGHHWLDEDDVAAVVDVLRSGWLTTGPKVAEFEREFANVVGAEHAVAVNSGTAALHAAVYAAGIGPGDEVIVPPITFAASANCVVYQGGKPVFVDVDPETLLLDPQLIEPKISTRTKAIIAVDYAGQPCDYDSLRGIADQHDLTLIADACHALGATYKSRPVGTLADLNTFSFHPVKHITTGEGGMVTTNNPELARRMRIFRNHGVTSDHRQRAKQGSWFYEMIDLGYNYRLTDIQCVLGVSQLRKLSKWIVRRQEIAQCYNDGFSELDAIEPIGVRDDVSHAYHLYVVQLHLNQLIVDRTEIYSALWAENIGANVHYIPVHWHPYYQNLGYKKGICPIAEFAYESLLSLPIFPAMEDIDVENVLEAISKIVNVYQE